MLTFQEISADCLVQLEASDQLSKPHHGMFFDVITVHIHTISHIKQIDLRKKKKKAELSYL